MEQDEFWREHVDAFLRQHGSQRNYCQQHGIPARELRKWRTRFYGPVRHRPASEPGAAPTEAGISEFSYAAPSGPGAVSADLTAATPVIRRRWSDEQKRQLVWDGLNSGQPLARYARHQGIHASVVHRWLRAFARPMLTAPQAEPPAGFAAVQITEPAVVFQTSAPPPPAHQVPSGQIEIDLVGGRRIRVGHDVDIDLLRRLIVVLETPA
ncbi:MAG: IS66-like element accessory protein TnpA [Janthinobacterium lividum]